MELDKIKNYQGGKYLPVPYKPINAMWIKTGYLTDFIESGGVDLPNHLNLHTLNNSKEGGYNKQLNYCPFCENLHKKYTLFKCHPAKLNGKKVEFYVCKDCRTVIENEDPFILEIVEEQIKESFPEISLPDNYTPKGWIEEKEKRKSKKVLDYSEDDYFKKETLSIYLKDFLNSGIFPEHSLDYSFDKRNKCIWCDSSVNLDTIDFPITSQFNLIIGRVNMCESCERHYYDILDRKLMPSVFTSEQCVQCKGYHYVSSSIHGDRILKEELDSHYCNTCLEEAGLETYPYNIQVKCKGCDVVVMENYDLTLNGKLIDEIYCYKCSEKYGVELAEEEAISQEKAAKALAKKVQTQETKQSKEELFGEYNEKASTYDISARTYSRRLYNKKFFIWIVIIFAKAYPSNEHYCYFVIEESLSKEDEEILKQELESFETKQLEDFSGLESKEDLLKGMEEKEYGYVTELYSSYVEDKIIYSLNGDNTHNAEKILECVDMAHKKASKIVYEYERRIRLPL